MKLNEPESQPDIIEANVLVVGEVREAIFWPTPGITDRTNDNDSTWFSAEGTLISASAILRRRSSRHSQFVVTCVLVRHD